MNIYEFMHTLPVEGEQSQVDALTITATGLAGKLAIWLVMREVEHMFEHEKRKPFKFNGATGWQAGSLRYAEKEGSLQNKIWSILMLTGSASGAAFKVAARESKDVKFTRCDLATDVFLYEKVVGLPRMIKDTYKGKHATKLIESDTGETLYVGSRESEAMLRVYDKSREYNLDNGRVWRWEVEYKRGIAHLVVQEVADGGILRIKELVFGEARQKDVPSPFIESMRGIKRSKVVATSAEMQLAWLGRQVAPTVRWLRQIGLEKEVFTALQLPMVGEVDEMLKV